MIKKADNGIWKYLTTEGNEEDVKKVWWQFKTTYEEDMKEYETLNGIESKVEEEAKTVQPAQMGGQGGAGGGGMQMDGAMQGQMKETILKMKKEQEDKKKDPNYKPKEKTGKPEDDFDFDDMDFDKMLGEMGGANFGDMFQNANAEGGDGMQGMKIEGMEG